MSRVLVNFLTLSASTWLQQVLNFLTVLYLAHALGADAFGQIAVAQALVLYFRAWIRPGARPARRASGSAGSG